MPQSIVCSNVVNTLRTVMWNTKAVYILVFKLQQSHASTLLCYLFEPNKPLASSSSTALVPCSASCPLPFLAGYNTQCCTIKTASNPAPRNPSHSFTTFPKAVPIPPGVSEASMNSCKRERSAPAKPRTHLWIDHPRVDLLM